MISRVLIGMLTVIGLLGDAGAGAAACKYEENCACAVPGITLRWKAAYCMAVAQTDDVEVGAVQQCLTRSDAPALRRQTGCQQNAHWKSRLCRVLGRGQAEVDACVGDRRFIPAFVERGSGG